MAEDSLSEWSNPFNQLSSSSSQADKASFQLSERVAKLEQTITLVAQANALSSIALRDAFSESSPGERYHYLAALNELIAAVSEQLDDLVDALRQSKKGR